MSSLNSVVFVSSDDDSKTVICKLCRLMYTLGWVTGTGGGISIRCVHPTNNQAFMTPSGVQKELIQPHDLFTVNLETGCPIDAPSNPALRLSQCSPLFTAIYQLRNAGAVIHSHSKNIVLASIMALQQPYLSESHHNHHEHGNQPEHASSSSSSSTSTAHQQPSNSTSQPSSASSSSLSCHHVKSIYQNVVEDDETSSWLAGEIHIGNFEMLKGIKGHGSRDTTVIPVIKNTEHERDLESSLRLALHAYPKTYAVVVERHGAYIWGDTWEEAKTQAECYDYLLEMSWRLKNVV